jgi:hypothetical protein
LIDDTLPDGLIPFNGFKKLHNVMTPISLGPVAEITWLDKYVYGLLRFIAGNSDRCRVRISGRGRDNRGQESLASQLKVSEDSVARSIARLSAAGLIYRRQSRNEVLVVFLESRHLYDSWPNETRPAPPWPRESDPESPAVTVPDNDSQPAEMRVLNSHPEPAGERVVKKSRTRNPAVENPQPCGREPADLRVAYKEFLGNAGNPKDKPPPQTPPASVAVALVPTGRFPEWWGIWTPVMGTNHFTQALRTYAAIVTAELEAPCFECTRSYLGSRGDRNGGYNPENFLRDQAKDRFAARFPAWKKPVDKNRRRREEAVWTAKEMRKK